MLFCFDTDPKGGLSPPLDVGDSTELSWVCQEKYACQTLFSTKQEVYFCRKSAKIQIFHKKLVVIPWMRVSWQLKIIFLESATSKYPTKIFGNFSLRAGRKTQRNASILFFLTFPKKNRHRKHFPWHLNNNLHTSVHPLRLSQSRVSGRGWPPPVVQVSKSLTFSEKFSKSLTFDLINKS